jgi:hypothetical protein
VSALLALNRHGYKLDAHVLQGWRSKVADAAATQNKVHGTQFRSVPPPGGRPTGRQRVMTHDEVVPHPQYRMCHARIISAPPTAVWDELRRVTMSALPLGYALESIRLLPARLAGRRHQPLTERTFLDVTPIPVLFCRPPRVVISAGLSQAWRLLGGLTPPRLDAAGLRAWSQPGWIKVAMEFRVEPTSAGTRLSTETRVAATDRRTRRVFAVYWFFIRTGSSAIRREVLRVVAGRAESPRTRPGATTSG